MAKKLYQDLKATKDSVYLSLPNLSGKVCVQAYETGTIEITVYGNIDNRDVEVHTFFEREGNLCIRKTLIQNGRKVTTGGD